MAAPYTTPGVYIVEKNAFPNSVVQVATALPVFLGFTEKATYNGKDLTNVPTRIDSLKQFEDYFGTGFVQKFKLTDLAAPKPKPADTTAQDGAKDNNGQPVKPAPTDVTTKDTDPLVAASQLSLLSVPDKKYQLAPEKDDQPLFYLYNSIRLFYLNGGATCYITSIDNYNKDYAKKAEKSEKQLFLDAIATLVYEQDPTMLLCPDALRLPKDDYNDVMKTMLSHCANVQSRVALFDVRDGAVTKAGDIQTKIGGFRDGVGQNFLNYGISYFPWVNTSVIADTDVSFYNLNSDSLGLLRQVLNATDEDLKASQAVRKSGQVEIVVPALGKPVDPKVVDNSNPPPKQAGDKDDAADPAKKADPANPGTAPTTTTPPQNIIDQAIALLNDQVVVDFDAKSAPDGYTNAQAVADKRRAIDNSLRTLYPDYKLIIKAITTYLNTLPVSPAMAGVYTTIDSSRGVWKAPANWSLTGVISPTVSLSDLDQGRLNVDPTTGKSVNVIRAFKGMGVLVWGARTLDGNSQDWRYINVRRTMIMIEQSVKLAAHNYVFEPNDANTWVTVKSAINSFLFNLWKQGALAGVVPDDAYQVLIGLGTTMTPDDILNGYMNVTVLVAIVRPAEFIELTFQQQMQKS